jgi:hypothetical protein
MLMMMKNDVYYVYDDDDDDFNVAKSKNQWFEPKTPAIVNNLTYREIYSRISRPQHWAGQIRSKKYDFKQNTL